ncbi:MAG: hypothetical protein JF597_50460 [Streptomyces sp.]|uniref:DUF6153 family protein n=1 Tax=Streptomyces sp. TaxID=1931 RepID=UPI0025DFBA03|nr:DUF6153 family protein [Streptomyces sp.]MBW8801479.1 hypothetical protein [Streptomyces sp.]
MTSPEQHPVRPPRRWRALLVLGLLAGLLGMHALAPGGLTTDRAHARPAAATQSFDDACAGGQCGGCLAQHADATCASGAVSNGPQPPVLVADPVAVPAEADAAHSYVRTGPDGPRAPPSLAELQLLRI